MLTSSRQRLRARSLQANPPEILHPQLKEQIARSAADGHQETQQDLADSLKDGLEHIDDVQHLFKYASDNLHGAELLLKDASAPRDPNCFVFDCSKSRHSSMEFSQLPGPFPPKGSSRGYTFMCWIKVKTFDASNHTTLFGLFDQSQTCFLLLYLERDRQQLVLQTSLSTNKPAVRFRKVTFSPGQWYHVALVHQRPSFESQSHISLLINGELTEHLQCNYPSSVPRDSAVQAFFGTIQAMVPESGSDASVSCWSLASAHLFSETLSPDLIFVYQNLGPCYQGNFQDALGSFHTFDASATLNLRIERLHPDEKDARSIIVRQVRSDARKANPENNILLSIFPASYMHRALGSEGVAGALSRAAFDNLRHKSMNGANGIVLNAAIPFVSDALQKHGGAGLLLGTATVRQQLRVGMAAWRESGFVIRILQMVQSVRSAPHLVTAFKAALAMVNESWRTNEVMERENGFGMLSLVFLKKLNSLWRQYVASSLECMDGMETLYYDCLKVALKFTGFNHSDPKASKMVNALAYRHLVVDCPIWRGTDASTQDLFFRQISAFSVHNAYEKFNVARLSRMRLIKKLIEIIKEHGVHAKALVSMLGAFRCLLKATPSSDNYRSVAMYVTFALHDEQGRLHKRPSVASALNDISKAQAQIIPDVIKGPPLGIFVLEELAKCLDSDADGPITRFATSVTNKWLLDLLSNGNDQVVTAALRILTRMFATLGLSYIQRFDTKTQGFVILQRSLRDKHHLPQIWSHCFLILFGADDRQWCLQNFDRRTLVDHVLKSRRTQVSCPAILSVISAMFEEAWANLSSTDGDSRPQSSQATSTHEQPQITEGSVDLLNTAIGCLEDFCEQSQDFREFTQRSQHRIKFHDSTYIIDVSFTKDLIKALYSIPARPAFLPEGDSSQTLEPLARVETSDLSSSSVPSPSEITATRPRQRNSSFVVVRSSSGILENSPGLRLPLSPPSWLALSDLCNSSSQRRLQLLLCAVLADQILSSKDFTGLGLFLKIPSSSSDYRASVASSLMNSVLRKLGDRLDAEPDLYLEPRVLTNLARFFSQSCEALYEGWLISVETPLLAFTGSLLHYLDLPSIRQNKMIRLCSPQIDTIRDETFKIALFNLSPNIHGQGDEKYADAIICLMAMQDLLLPEDGVDPVPFRALCSLLYRQLWSSVPNVRAHALSLWRSFLAQRPQEISKTLTAYPNMSESTRSVARSFCESLENIADVGAWLHRYKSEMDAFFNQGPDRDLNQVIQDCNQRSEQTAEIRIKKRHERVERWHLQELQNHHTMTEHQESSQVMTDNICESELLKLYRSQQDQQESLHFLESLYIGQEKRLQLLVDLHGSSNLKWQLDESEGKDRMRMRLIPSDDSVEPAYQPKRRNTLKSRSTPKNSGMETKHLSQVDSGLAEIPSSLVGSSEPGTKPPTPNTSTTNLAEDFEVISIQNKEQQNDLEEDKNRKVMRSLQRGEIVEDACNISIIYGLEAVETLLIIGNSSLYLVENLFQRKDGEVVNASDAPLEERDPYIKTISGQKIDAPGLGKNDPTKTRHWSWRNIVSISKRRFLFRDVALELFFKDGRSYLLTASSTLLRDGLCNKLELKVQDRRDVTQQPVSESLWRTALSQASRPSSSSLGSRVASVFGSSAHKAATRSWAKGEMSNFQYLMLVNTLAGRTFNDLTQYPVFPWVIADYHSEELDLTDPRTFRDLSKPMGCQSLQREMAFRDRYKSFAEMDDTTPAFHYGTHYSSAMIVTSFLIRLQPFVKSYLLLQGGTFDHAERLFQSIEKAWVSASNESNSDVRELTPEFYYLPDFLVNVNGYNFGIREGSGEAINNVKLPPWARGDPAIFIAKQREALESSYVSQNLHAWIDLIFGFKQRGDAAIEATNVFHYLTYEGARNIDEITDEHERIATIGIIHNFGQTPKQVFHRPHDQREDVSRRSPSLISQLTSLRRTAAPLSESKEQVKLIQWSSKDQKIVQYSPFTVPIPSSPERFVQWGFADRSIRFYSSDRDRLLKTFEQPHEDQVAALAFADGNTLITASDDCTLALWSVSNLVDNIDVQPKATLFGHKHRITLLAVSLAFGIILSASSDGIVLTWDLNRNQAVRKIDILANLCCLHINDANGHILLCTSQTARLYTLNGALLLDQPVCSSKDGQITCASFYIDINNAWLGSEVIFTGHERGNVKIWRVGIGKAMNNQGTFWNLELVRTLDHDIRVSDAGVEPGAAVTAIEPINGKLYVGGEDGKIFEWVPVR